MTISIISELDILYIIVDLLTAFIPLGIILYVLMRGLWLLLPKK